jgi:hypothetical protein
MAPEERQTLTVATGDSPAVLGGTLNAVVTISGEPDHKVKGAKATLVRTGRRRLTQTDVLGHGQHNTLIHEDVVLAETPVATSGGKVVPGGYVVSLAVPADDLPSAADQVSWSVRAVIERHFGVDVKARAPVEVLVGPDRFANEATGEARYKGEQCVDLDLSTRTLRPGETIAGSVVLRPTKAMTVTEVLACFVVSASVKNGLEGTAVAATSLLKEPLVLQPGDPREFPFQLTLPEKAPPSARGSMTTPSCHSCISWDVAGEARVLLSPDDEESTRGFVYLGVNVYNAP